MGQHKYNPNTIKAKNGELPPKKKTMSKRKREAILRKQIQDKTGLPTLVRELGGEYFYI
jgi:hypothetical protein